MAEFVMKVIVGIFVTGIGGLVLYGAWVLLRQELEAHFGNKRAQHWPTTEGVILSSEAVRRTVRVTEPRIKYKFTAVGTEYVSERIWFSGAGQLGKYASASEVVTNYPVGTQCTVHYDPSAPSESVLELNKPGLGCAPFAFVFVLVPVGIGAIAVGISGLFR